MQTYHCNVLSVAGYGILIEGPSGSGKTSLTMGLLERAAQAGLEAFLISDDRAFLEIEGKALIALPPETLAGKMELRGYGIVEYPYQQSAQISVVVSIINDDDLDRLPDPNSTTISGITLPKINVPARHEQAAIRIVFAWLKDNKDSRIPLAL